MNGFLQKNFPLQVFDPKELIKDSFEPIRPPLTPYWAQKRPPGVLEMFFA